MVSHRLSDLAAAGDAGSANASKATALAREVGSRFVLGLDPTDAADVATALQLGEQEAQELPRLPRGRALALVGDRHDLVDVVVASGELDLVRTDPVGGPG